MLRFKPALNSKGLRQIFSGCPFLPSLQASPEFKGIKTLLCYPMYQHCELQASPEFKGIKTVFEWGDHWGAPLQASPEFKGIKTCSLNNPLVCAGFKPALNSKGLRPEKARATL